jgi:hypothetical protein
MRETTGDLWDYAGWKVIPTNGDVKKDGKAVMGAGLAKQCADRYPEIPRLVGRNLTIVGNVPFFFARHKLITFPTKNHFYEPALLSLVLASARTISKIEGVEVFLPRVGCGLGGLEWEIVGPALAAILAGDHFVVVHKEEG